jgi:hypothetical protein
MADMARVLITYHFGGIYMDLDFYCYRSFECLENYLVRQIHSKEKLFAGNPQATSFASSVSSGGYNKTHYLSSDILIVSREPEIHSQFIHHRSRVVIQDFFFATPKHPFLRWFLEAINTQFKEGNLKTKGPFSYSIQGILDEYYQKEKFVLADGSNSLLATRVSDGTKGITRREYILEMAAEVIHPLLDSTNSQLSKGCHPRQKETITRLGLTQICRDFLRGKYLFPTANTMMVHMWTHSFLCKENCIYSTVYLLLISFFSHSHSY